MARPKIQPRPGIYEARVNQRGLTFLPRAVQRYLEAGPGMDIGFRLQPEDGQLRVYLKNMDNEVVDTPVFLSRFTEAGQVTIPRAVRKVLNMSETIQIEISAAGVEVRAI